MNNVVSTIIKFTTVGYEKAQSALQGVGKAGNLVGRSFASMAMSLGTIGGSLGKAASQASAFLWSVSQLGAIGGIVAGTQIVITAVCNKIVDGYNRMAEAAARAGDVIRERLARQIEGDMKTVANALDAATTQAQRQAKALETVADAYLKVSQAKDAADKAASGERASALSLERSQKMSEAATSDEKARVGAEYDVRIAKENLADVTREQDAAVEAAKRDAEEKRRRAKRAESDERMAERAAKIAGGRHDDMVNAGAADGVVAAFAEKRKAAEEAAENATNNRVAKEAEYEAAEEAVRAALSAREAAVNNARRAVVDSEAAERDLAKAQAAATAAEIARTRAEIEATRKATRDDAIAALRRQIAEGGRLKVGGGTAEDQSTSFARHFALWRDPEAAQAAQDAAKRESADLKAFNRSVNRYGGKGKIDEAAFLMRTGDTEGLNERLEQWRKSAKFNGQTEQMVLAAAARQNENAAERSLAQIEKNTANLSSKLDELLKAK